MDGFTYGLLGLGAAYASDDPALAARFIGQADRLREEVAIALEPFELQIRDEAEATIRASLGEDAYAAETAKGRALSLEDALTFALQPTAPLD